MAPLVLFGGSGAVLRSGNDFDLVLNSVAAIFVLDIDDHAYALLVPTSSRMLVSRLPSLTIDPGGGGGALLRAFGLDFLEPLVGTLQFRGGAEGGGGGEQTDHLRPLLRVGTAAYMYLTFAGVCIIADLTVAFFWCGKELEELSHERWTQTPVMTTLSSQPAELPTDALQLASPKRTGVGIVTYVLLALGLVRTVGMASLKWGHWRSGRRMVAEDEEEVSDTTPYTDFEAVH